MGTRAVAARVSLAIALTSGVSLTSQTCGGSKEGGGPTGPSTSVHLTFSVQPRDVIVGATMLPAVEVSVADAQGNVVTSATTSITLTINPPTGAPGARLGGTVTRGVVDGVATFGDLSIDKVSPYYSLKATAPGFASVGSTAFAVNAGTAAQVVVGWDDGCALTPAGLAYCWGANTYGQLGDPTTTLSTSTLVAVTGGHVFEQLAAGYYHNCGLTGSGQAYCWGNGEAGQLGNGSVASSATPVPVAGGLTFGQLTAGDSYTCGLASAGVAYCWGLNFMGELGNGTTTNSSTPVRVSGGLTFVEITAGFRHACGLGSDSLARCWGDAWISTGSLTPVLDGGGVRFAHLTAGALHTCGLTGAGRAHCWDSGWPPTPAGGDFTFVRLDAGANHDCGLTAAGAAYCWGNNSSGQLGHPDTDTLTAVAGGFIFAQVAGGGNHTCGRTRSGAVYCWGLNDMGQLGTGGTGGASVSPVRLLGF